MVVQELNHQHPKFEFIEKSHKLLKQNYSARVLKKQNGFSDFDDFLNWYKSQDKICNYCKLTESESQEIVMSSLLSSNRFPQKGKIGRGQSRGVWLEVDRLNPNEKYSRQNCVLCCYFCNNDKSDVFDGVEYFKFRENRLGFLRDKLKR